MTYQLEGSILEVCNCNILCPCWVGEDPDRGTCDSVMAWHIDRGDDRRARRLRPDHRPTMPHPRQRSAGQLDGRLLRRRPRHPGAAGGAASRSGPARRAARWPTWPSFRRGRRRSSACRSPSPSRAARGRSGSARRRRRRDGAVPGPTGEIDDARRDRLLDDPRRARLRRQGQPTTGGTPPSYGLRTSTCTATTRSRAVSASRCNRRWPRLALVPRPRRARVRRRGGVGRAQEEAQLCRSASTTAGRFSSPCSRPDRPRLAGALALGPLALRPLPRTHGDWSAHPRRAAGGGPCAAAVVFVAGWMLMTVAMMLPTSLPLLALFHAIVRPPARAAGGSSGCSSPATSASGRRSASPPTSAIWAA